MALWHIITGRVAHWNAMRAEARDHVYGVLRTFVPTYIEEYGNHNTLVQCRNKLFIHFVSMHICALPDLIDDVLLPYHTQLFSLSTVAYLRFLSAFHLPLILSQANNEEKFSALHKDNEKLSALRMNVLARMYKLPSSCISEWKARSLQIDTFPDELTALFGSAEIPENIASTLELLQASFAYGTSQMLGNRQPKKYYRSVLPCERLGHKTADDLTVLLGRRDLYLEAKLERRISSHQDVLFKDENKKETAEFIKQELRLDDHEK
jgi:hypothetical protein